MDAAELGAWLRLTETPLLARESVRKLLAAFGSAEAVIRASATSRREVVGPGKADSLATEPDSLAALIKTTLAWIADAPEPRDVITLGDPRYPAALLATADPPLVLYAQGRFDLLQADAVAIVGSRNPTPQGIDNARAFASHLSHSGLTIASGLAIGIDAAAHDGGLEGAASTIAVVGTGLDQVYPKRNHALRQRIAVQGLIVSEYSLGMPPLAVNFPRRNRIIAGLAQGTLVVEAAVQSGSLITARLANEAGREVFAIPGSIHSPQARGCHALIKQGAKLVETAADILEELRRPGTPGAAPGKEKEPAEDVDSVLAALGFDPATLDALIARTGGSAAEVSVRLLDLEMDGKVSRLPGQLFQRVTRG
jgi:DNA processing protein